MGPQKCCKLATNKILSIQKILTSKILEGGGGGGRIPGSLPICIKPWYKNMHTYSLAPTFHSTASVMHVVALDVLT